MFSVTNDKDYSHVRGMFSSSFKHICWFTSSFSFTYINMTIIRRLTIKRLLQCSETCTVFYKIHVLVSSSSVILALNFNYLFFSCRIHILKMGKCINCMKWEKRFQNIVHKGYKRWGFFKITQNKIYIDVYLIFSF